ncbi:hypothetical protein BGZ93_008067 [Podila epicladia]|nr:hypothetical protein BGZ92_009518 [Podila epicladia]KAG0099353.1 hypothetical protein BGZ93_008067 [Podila epicladia]
MLSNKTFRPLFFAAAVAFMLMATVEAAPAAEADNPPPVSHAQRGPIALAAAPPDIGAISTSAGAPKPADQETSHKGSTTAPSKNNGAITSTVVKVL